MAWSRRQVVCGLAREHQTVRTRNGYLHRCWRVWNTRKHDVNDLPFCTWQATFQLQAWWCVCVWRWNLWLWEHPLILSSFYSLCIITMHVLFSIIYKAGAQTFFYSMLQWSSDKWKKKHDSLDYYENVSYRNKTCPLLLSLYYQKKNLACHKVDFWGSWF